MSDKPISAADVKALRDDTGAGMMDCKRALTDAGGDVAQAKELLRTWGLAGVEKRKVRVASEGVAAAYLHEVGGLPPKLGVLLELDCETDFVAKTPEFRELARNLAMQVAAMEPRWVSRDDVPVDFLENERKIIAGSDELANKPENIRDKIVEGKLGSILSGKGGVLLEQVYVRDESGKRKVGDIVSELGASVKENIVVRRFARFRVGEDD
ncbi:MAG TPA: translation elongation factor Ts [Actinomycetota bacterium]|nr:translation elongation factor Ts [Actinomycetota bacterium]